MRRLTRRRFLQSGAAGSLWVAAGGMSLAGLGCADDELNPDNRNLIWIAQSVEGTVYLDRVGGTRVDDAAVTFRVSLDRSFWFTFGSGRTDGSGQYRFSAARSGHPNAYWVLEPPDDRVSFPVYTEVTVGKTNVGTATAAQTLTRRPSKEEPTGNLAPYQISQNVLIITEPPPGQ